LGVVDSDGAFNGRDVHCVFFLWGWLDCLPMQVSNARAVPRAKCPVPRTRTSAGA
jgi:hypothetical protein